LSRKKYALGLQARGVVASGDLNNERLILFINVALLERRQAGRFFSITEKINALPNLVIVRLLR
jgi:hypothetical protein